MEGVNGAGAECEPKPLSEVVDDCVQRWFQDAFKEARRGDTAMMVLVAQMYHSGYGVPKNEHKVCHTGCPCSSSTRKSMDGKGIKIQVFSLEGWH
ncbi:uncharacterized protein LOC133928689 isoform X2 [Phragmites australis]|uniref:uncharacterized protein LOC133928689 isoform X2 n=1 Tax=Phragmites australis TaxID=29695 RepID=UPI002D79CBD4|nr:uncharacterized protein LOC133928689 isoform X2 [Phragmites australis]